MSFQVNIALLQKNEIKKRKISAVRSLPDQYLFQRHGVFPDFFPPEYF